MKITPEGSAEIDALIRSASRDPRTVQRTLLRIRNYVFGPFYYEELGRPYYDQIYGDECDVRILWDDILLSSQMWTPELGAVAHALQVMNGDVQFARAQVAGIEITDPAVVSGLSLPLQKMAFGVREETYLITASKTFLSPAAIDEFAPSLISQDLENRDWVECPPEKWGPAIHALLKKKSE